MAKILLVEDDINLREIYAARLQAENYGVVTASDGEEALAKAVAEKPDLIMLDVMMPKISGFDVLDILRSTPETKDTKVIMLTALSQDIDKTRGEQLGVNKYLVKSQITLEDVVEAVHSTLNASATPSDNSINTTGSQINPSADPLPVSTPMTDGSASDITPSGAAPLDFSTSDNNSPTSNNQSGVGPDLITSANESEGNGFKPPQPGTDIQPDASAQPQDSSSNS